MIIKPNKYQEQIFDFIVNKKGNAVVQAVAGSGKTWTIVEGTKLIPPHHSAIFVAFNKSIQVELSKKLPGHVKAKTLHSLGYGMFFSNAPEQKEINQHKLKDIIEESFKDASTEKKAFLRDIIPLIKATLCEVNIDSIMDLAEEYNVSNFEFITEATINSINKILKRCLEHNTIDFDDMIWIPLVKNFKCRTYDWVFVDETQDLNKAQLELIKKVCNGHTRIIAVGDRRQSIYAFRGADTNSIDNFKEHFNAEELPLSICYRCPKKVIDLAQTIVPEIEAPDTAPDGAVNFLDESFSYQDIQQGDLILCRTNAPLIETAFSLIRMHKKVVVRGTDIGKNILNIVNKFECNTLADLVMTVLRAKERQQSILERIEREGLRRKEDQKARAMRLIDIYDTIIAISENTNSLENFKKVITDLFSDKEEGIICSSVHKAKGLEYENVYILGYHSLMPHPMAETQKELEQERNIKYVAVTRAKKVLNLICN